jgi:hypothetical protein
MSVSWGVYKHHIVKTPYGKFFHGIMLSFVDEYIYKLKPNGSLMLFCEPVEAIEIFENVFPGMGIVSTPCTKTDLGFKYDLNVPFRFPVVFDGVFSQATIEHVCRPSIAIENLVNMCTIGGHLVLHTHSQRYPYHKSPIDCVRFFKDFFVDLQNYLSVELVAHNEVCGKNEKYSQHFVVYKRLR